MESTTVIGLGLIGLALYLLSKNQNQSPITLNEIETDLSPLPDNGISSLPLELAALIVGALLQGNPTMLQGYQVEVNNKTSDPQFLLLQRVYLQLKATGRPLDQNLLDAIKASAIPQ